MALYWRLSDIPELGPLSSGQQKEVWAATLTKRLRDPILLMVILPCACVAGLGGYLGCSAIGGSHGVAIGAGVGGAICNLIFWPISMVRSRPFLAAEVRTRSK